MVRFFKKLFGEKCECRGVTREELSNEIADLKKIIRKQTLAMEMHRDELAGRIDAKSLKDVSRDMLQEIAGSFFHLESITRESGDISTSHSESFEIAWKKIEAVLGVCGLELIRKSGCPFDARLHEATAAAHGPASSLRVAKVIQPGYLYAGKVICPAKVVLEQAINAPD